MYRDIISQEIDSVKFVDHAWKALDALIKGDRCEVRVLMSYSAAKAVLDLAKRRSDAGDYSKAMDAYYMIDEVVEDLANVVREYVRFCKDKEIVSDVAYSYSDMGMLEDVIVAYILRETGVNDWMTDWM